MKISTSEQQSISNKIYTIRGMQVMIDTDLSDLYQVEIRALNQSVKRNKERFPPDFMFQLTQEEYEALKSQIVTLNNLGRGQHRKYLPYVFTEQGVAMLSGVLKSSIAIKVSLQIIQAFVQMRKMVTDNLLLHQRMNLLENKLFITDSKIEQVFKAIEDKEIKPEEGIFFEGQVFDAYVFVSKLIKQAKKSITLIDNYADETILTLLSKRAEACSVIIYTKKISKKLQLDLEKHNEQYSPIEIIQFNDAHDRFLILDESEVYHIGASLKDLGKKWFGFSRLDKSSVREILRKLPLPNHCHK